MNVLWMLCLQIYGQTHLEFMQYPLISKHKWSIFNFFICFNKWLHPYLVKCGLNDQIIENIIINYNNIFLKQPYKYKKSVMDFQCATNVNSISYLMFYFHSIVSHIKKIKKCFISLKTRFTLKNTRPLTTSSFNSINVYIHHTLICTYKRIQISS